jgi:aspartate/methionine/tyrosine aminotransferase
MASSIPNTREKSTPNSAAEALNKIIKEEGKSHYQLLSHIGRMAFFPKKGILAQAAEAKGKSINATIGMSVEDNGAPMHLSSMFEGTKLSAQEIYPYASSYGKPELRSEWQKQIFRKNPSLKTTISLPVMTAGLTHGLSIVGKMFLEEGDEVILSKEFWGNYRLVFEQSYGAHLKSFNTFKNHSFDLESFQQTINEQKSSKKVVLLNFPNNPTGYTPTEEEIEEISSILKESANQGNNILVICDDAYFGLVFKEGIYKESIFAKLANLHQNILAIKIDGSTKEDYNWGSRVAAITYGGKGLTQDGYTALAEKTAGLVRGNLSNIPHISQSALLHALQAPSYQEEKNIMFTTLKSRFDEVIRVLDKNSELYEKYFTTLPFNSGYFMCLKVNEGMDAEKIRKTLLEKYDTGLIAIGNLLRIAFSSVPKNDLERLFENIYKASQDSSS